MHKTHFLLTALFVSSLGSSAFGQAPLPEPAPPPPDAQGAPLPAPPQVAASYPPQELDRIVSPIALYPDSLLGQVLTAATFSPEIPEAARWADQHHYVPPAELPAAIAADRLPWQPSVQALLPFPQVLEMMASDMPWTEEIGAAFLASPDQVMDAVQRMRQSAYNYGYLRSNAQVVVQRGAFIEIAPVDPAFVVVPYYNPAVVFVAPRPGFVLAGAVRFGYGVRVGVAFAPWGWGTTRFGWGEHVLIVNNAPWRRTWVNRTVYVHPFVAVPRYAVPRAAGPERAVPRVVGQERTVPRAVGQERAVPRAAAEAHAVHPRTEHEREAERNGRRHEEEHRK